MGRAAAQMRPARPRPASTAPRRASRTCQCRRAATSSSRSCPPGTTTHTPRPPARRSARPECGKQALDIARPATPTAVSCSAASVSFCQTRTSSAHGGFAQWMQAHRGSLLRRQRTHQQVGERCTSTASTSRKTAKAKPASANPPGRWGLVCWVSNESNTSAGEESRRTVDCQAHGRRHVTGATAQQQ